MCEFGRIAPDACAPSLLVVLPRLVPPFLLFSGSVRCLSSSFPRGLGPYPRAWKSDSERSCRGSTRLVMMTSRVPFAQARIVLAPPPLRRLQAQHGTNMARDGANAVAGKPGWEESRNSWISMHRPGNFGGRKLSNLGRRGQHGEKLAISGPNFAEIEPTSVANWAEFGRGAQDRVRPDFGQIWLGSRQI